MIKNNFKILNEERNHILNLVRLPNYRKPINLSEQWAAELMPTKEKSTITTDSTKRIEFFKKKGGLGTLNFSDPMEVKKFFDVTFDHLVNGWRSSAFGYFNEALGEASKLYGDERFSKWKKDLETAATEVNSKIKNLSSNKITDFDSFSSPPDYEIDIYQKKILTDQYNGVAVWKLKMYDVNQSKLGFGADQTTAGSGQESQMSKGEEQSTVKKFLDDSKKGMDSVATKETCVALLTNYLSDIVPGRTQVIGDELSLIKKTLSYCNQPTTSVTTNPRGKSKIKIQGNAFGRINRRLRKALESLGTRTDKFKIDFTNPENN